MRVDDVAFVRRELDCRGKSRRVVLVRSLNASGM